MLLCTKIRLQVGEADAAALEFMQGKCRGLYNWWVMRLRDGERWPGWEEAKASLQASRLMIRNWATSTANCLRRSTSGWTKPCRPSSAASRRGRRLAFPACALGTSSSRSATRRLTCALREQLILPTGGGGTGTKRVPNVVATLTEVPALLTFGRWRSPGMHAGTTTPPLSMRLPKAEPQPGQVVAFDLGIKTLAIGRQRAGALLSHRRIQKGHQWYNEQLDKIRSKRDRCKKKSRTVHSPLARSTSGSRNSKRNKHRDCLHKASHLIAHPLVESTVVIGDLSQRQMVTKAHQEKRRSLHRAVYNDWGLYGFVQMLTYKCLRWERTDRIDERYTQDCTVCGHRQAMPLWKRTYRCGNCGLVMDRDENSAVNIRERFLARLGPHTGDPVRCAAPQTQQSTCLNTL